MNGLRPKQCSSAPQGSFIARDGDRCVARIDFPLPRPRSVEELARERLTAGCPYAFYFKSVVFQFREGTLTLRGRVKTFYLKQMLQTWLRGLDGVNEIDNQVDVVSATSVSSQGR